MDKEQLVQLILDTYSARKETKEYLDFFLNPDVEKLLAKYELAVFKEMNRTRRGGYCKARISVLRKYIKEFSSYKPGFQNEIDFLLYIVCNAIMVERYVHFPDTLINGVASIVRELMDISDRNFVADTTLTKLKSLLGCKQTRPGYFLKHLDDELDSYLKSVKPSMRTCNHVFTGTSEIKTEKS